MNEKNLFDDIARILASPVPRRQAFGHIRGDWLAPRWPRFSGKKPPGRRSSVRRASPRAGPSAARMAGLVATARRASAATRAITARGGSARRNRPRAI